MAYSVGTLPFDSVPDFASKGQLNTLQEEMSHAGSSVVLPAVNFEERGTLLDRLVTLSEEVLVDRSREIPSDWIDNIQGKEFKDTNDLNGASLSVLIVPVEGETLNNAIRDTESKLSTRSHVSILTGRYSFESTNEQPTRPHEEGGGQRHLMATSNGFTNTTSFDDYIYFSADSMSGILFGLTMVWVLVLATSCTMDIQCPSQIWTHPNLPLKGRVEFE